MHGYHIALRCFRIKRQNETKRKKLKKKVTYTVSTLSVNYQRDIMDLR